MTTCASPKREHSFGARPDRDPFVRVGAGLRHARFDLDESASNAGTSLTHLAERLRMSHGRVPRAEEIGAEADDEARFREVERRQLLAAEAAQVRQTQDIVREHFEDNRRRRAETAQEPAHDFMPDARPPRGHEGERALLSRRGERVEPRDELGRRSVPADRFELTAASWTDALHRSTDSIGVIGDLNRGLPARTKAAAIERVRRIAFELLRHVHPDDPGLALSRDLGVGFHDADVQAASRRAGGADARLPLRDARHQVLVRNEPNQLMFGIPAARERRGSPADGRELDERAPIHMHVGPALHAQACRPRPF